MYAVVSNAGRAFFPDEMSVVAPSMRTWPHLSLWNNKEEQSFSEIAHDWPEGTVTGWISVKHAEHGGGAKV